MKKKYSEYITLGYDSEGKRIRKRAYGNTKKELALEIAKLQEAYNSTPGQDQTFGAYSQRWKSVFKDMLNPNTVEMYFYALKHTTVLDKINIKAITEQDCQQVIKDNWEHPSECKKIEMTLNEIFKRAIKEKIITENPAADLTMPDVVNKPKRALTEKEKVSVRNLISIDDDRLIPRNKMFLACEYYFGLRPEETRGLMFSDFDLSKMEVTIQRAVSHDKNDCLVKVTKTNNIRVIPIPNAFVSLFKWYRMLEKKLYLFTLLGTVDKLITKSAQRKILDNIKSELNKACGGTENLCILGSNFTFYVFRREFATRLYYSGISIKKASYLMGHASTRMILEIYAQLDDARENILALREVL